MEVRNVVISECMTMTMMMLIIMIIIIIAAYLSIQIAQSIDVQILELLYS